MKISQFEFDGSGFVAVEISGKWINYSKAFASYYLLELGVAVRQPQSITELLQLGVFDISAMKLVVDHVTKNRLQKFLTLPKHAVLKAPIARPSKIIALGSLFRPSRSLNNTLKSFTIASKQPAFNHRLIC